MTAGRAGDPPDGDHFTVVYRDHAAAYDRLVTAEDHAGNLPRALAATLALTGAVVVDLGTGTGRVARLVASRARLVVGLDLHRAMLEEQHGRTVGPLVQADARALPLRASAADVCVAGWAIGHLRSWFAADWAAQAGSVIDEMLRVARPGGHLAVLETLGTGRTTPAPPGPELAEYYRWLEQHHGFARHEVRTDYRFSSPKEAEETLGFFFGPDLVASIRANAWAVVPEWTGLWVRSR